MQQTPTAPSTPQPQTPTAPSTPPFQTPQPSPTLPPVPLLDMANFSMPLSNSRDAPRFASDPFSFDAFFEDVSELATRAGLSAADTIKWALRYAGAEADSW